MVVDEFLDLLAQQSVWNYEVECIGFRDKCKAILRGIVPTLTLDGRVLLRIYGLEEGNEDDEE